MQATEVDNNGQRSSRPAVTPIHMPFNRTEAPFTLVSDSHNGVIRPGLENLTEGIKEKLRHEVRIYGQNASRKVLGNFAVARAAALHVYGFSNPRLFDSVDDRFADNMDVIFDTLRFEIPYVLSPEIARARVPERVKQMAGFTALLSEHEAAGTFLMRSHSEYLKLIIFYGDIKTDRELLEFLSATEKVHEQFTRKVPAEFFELYLLVQNVDSPPKLLKATNSVLAAAQDRFSQTEEPDAAAAAMVGNSYPAIRRIRINNCRLLIENPELYNFKELGKNRNFFDNITDFDFEFLDNLFRNSGCDEKERPHKIQAFISLPSNESFAKLSENLNQLYTDGKITQAALKDFIGLAQSPKDRAALLHYLGNVISPTSKSIITAGQILERIKGFSPPNSAKPWLVAFLIADLCSDATTDMLSALNRPEYSEQIYDFVSKISAQSDYRENCRPALGYLLSKGLTFSSENLGMINFISDYFNGIIPPLITEEYLLAEGAAAKASVLSRYSALSKKVFSDVKLPVLPLAVLAEVVYLAYRPSRTTIAEISKQIAGGELELGDQLKRLKVRQEGYPIDLQLLASRQIVNFDFNKFKIARDIIIEGSASEEKRNADLALFLSLAPADSDRKASFIAAVLAELQDPRVLACKDSTFGVIPSEADRENLQYAREILAVVPDEENFKVAFKKLLFAGMNEGQLLAEVERYLWKLRKGKYTPKQRECKNLIEQTIKEVDKSTDISFFIGRLKSEFSEIIADSGIDNCTTAEDFKNCLSKFKLQYFLGKSVGQSDSEYIFETYYNVARQLTRKASQDLTAEHRKIKTIASEEQVKATAYISKNAASFYAKHSVEICTAGNIEMWREPRHFHLNIESNNRLIANVMLYFEEQAPLNQCLIVRGINPSWEAMSKYDRGSMVNEIVRVLQDIANDNNLEDVFVPEQTGFHALTNRDGVAVELERRIRRTAAQIRASDTGKPTEFTAAFSFTSSKKEGNETVKFLLLSSRKFS